MKDQKLSVIQLSQRTGLFLDHIYKLIYAGRIRAEKVGGRWIIDPESAERFLQRRKARMEQMGEGDASKESQ